MFAIAFLQKAIIILKKFAKINFDSTIFTRNFVPIKFINKMTTKLFLTFTLLFGLSVSTVFAQDNDKNADKRTKEGIGFYAGLEAINAPRDLSPAVFAPDLIYRKNDNTVGIGPRIILVNTNSAKDDRNENVWGAGLNYQHFLSRKHLFDWFVYFDLEYYKYSSVSSSSVIVPHDSMDVNKANANHYNFVTGFGYHLHLLNHIYMSGMLGLGIGIEGGTEYIYNTKGAYYDPITSRQVNGKIEENVYSNKSVSPQGKIGIGYIF